MSANKNIYQTFAKKVLITIGIAILSIVIILLAFFAVEAIFSLFAAILLAVFLRGLADLLNQYTGIAKSYSVLIVCVLIGALIYGGFWLLAPDIAEQLISLRDFIPQAFVNLKNQLTQYQWGVLLLEQLPAWEELYHRFYSRSFLTSVGGVFSTTFGATANLIVIILMGVYLASSPKIYTSGLVKLFPPSKRPRVKEITKEIGETLRLWLVGKIASMFLVGLLTTVGLYLLGVPLALSLGIIAALLAFIPNFGPIIAVIPAVLFALTQSPTKALYVLILYFAIQMVESYLITPLIQQKAVSLPPVLTIFFQLFLGVLVGGIGLVLATPLLTVLIVLVKMLYIEDILGDQNINLPSDAEV